MRRQSPSGSLVFLHVLCIDALIAFTLNSICKDVSVVNSLRRYSISLLSEGHVSLQFSIIRLIFPPEPACGQTCLLPIIKVVSSLRSGFLSCNTTHWDHLCHSVILGDKRSC